MEVFEGVDAYDRGSSPSILSIGNFDGVHLAHREICRFIREEAARRGGRSVILTFDPHPLSIVAPERRPPLMTTLEEKLARLEAQNVDAVVIEKFTRRLARTEARDFARRIICEGLGASLVVIGFNFRFGKGRAGNVELLRREGAGAGFETRVLDPYVFEGRRVSSTEIRKLLLGGAVEEAARLLAQRHVIEGRVVRGDGRGRRIGVPTANVDYPSVLVPQNGVYACWARIEEREGRRHPAVANIGNRPTFDKKERTLETHLLNWEGDLYGKSIRLEFVSRLREERKFSGPEELVRQIRVDIEDGRKKLSSQAKKPRSPS